MPVAEDLIRTIIRNQVGIADAEMRIGDFTVEMTPYKDRVSVTITRHSATRDTVVAQEWVDRAKFAELMQHAARERESAAASAAASAP